MSDRQFVDTNILIYAYDTSAGQKHLKAQALLERLWREGTGCLSVQVLQEFYVNVTKKICKPLPSEQASLIIDNYRVWPVYSLSIADIVNSISIQKETRISFWDALIICAAYNLGAGQLWTEDLNNGQEYCGVRAVCPW